MYVALFLLLCGYALWALDHLVKCRTCRHHWVNGLFLFHTEFKYNRAFGLARPLDGIIDFFTFGHQSGRDAMCFRKFYKIRRKHVDCRITFLEEELLPLAHHAKKVIVHDRNLYIRTLLNGSG